MNQSGFSQSLYATLSRILGKRPGFSLRVHTARETTPLLLSVTPTGSRLSARDTEPAEPAPLADQSWHPLFTTATDMAIDIALEESGSLPPLSDDARVALEMHLLALMQEKDHHRLLHQFDVLCDINREINYRWELTPLLDSIAENTSRLIGADAVSIMLYDERQKSFKTIAGWKSWQSNEPAVIFSANEGIIGKVAKSHQGMLVTNPERHPDFKPQASTSRPPIISMMCAPLMARMNGEEQLMGVINTSRRDFEERTSKQPFTESDLRLFEKFADQVTGAIQRSTVFEETHRRTHQLQIVNDLSRSLSTSLDNPENFQTALDLLVERLHLSYGHLVVQQGKDVLYNFNTLHRNGFMPTPVLNLVRKGQPGARARFVRTGSVDRQILPLELKDRHFGFLYLESEDPLILQNDQNTLVIETVKDQMLIALENFLLFREIQQSNRRLEELNNMKNELISIVSHDFRTPLTVIHAYSELLLLQPEMAEETRAEYLNSIFAQIGHLRRLADGALKITRIESGEMAYCFERIEFQAVTEKFAARRLPKHQIRFVTERNLPAMKADFDKLFEIMDNLISNAIKYSPAGGEITVRARHRGDFVEIQVKDRGIGIPSDQIGNLFQKYFRIHDEKTKHIRGTGLGLYICKRLVEGHGGQIGVRSKPEKGATFFFTLPVFHES